MSIVVTFLRRFLPFQLCLGMRRRQRELKGRPGQRDGERSADALSAGGRDVAAVNAYKRERKIQT